MALRFSTDMKTAAPADAIDATASGNVVLPDGISLVGAAFVRAGPDLLVATPDGRQIIVRDYFREADAPDLFDAGGARVDGATVTSLVGPIAPDQLAQAAPGPAPGPAAQPIGHADVASGTVSVVRDGVARDLAVGDPVYQGDVIRTGADGTVGILLADRTITTLGNASRLVLDEMIFDPESEEGSLNMTAVEGLFVVVSGAIAKSSPDAMVIKTPAASIGIRGTLVYLKVSTEGVWLSLGEEAGGYVGQVVVQNDISFVSMDFTGKLVFVPGWVGEAVIRDGGEAFIASDFDMPRETLEKIFETLDIETEAGLPDDASIAALEGLIQATTVPTLVAPTYPELQTTVQGFNGITVDQNQAGVLNGAVDFTPDSPLDEPQPAADNAPPPAPARQVTISLDDDVFPENVPGFSAELIINDEGANDTFSFAIEPGLNGDLFEISQDGVLSLAAGAVLDHEDPAFPDPTRQVVVTVTDADGLSVTQALTIRVGDINEAPTAIALDNVVFPENAAGLSANLIVSDEDTNDTFTFAIEAGLIGDLFEISQDGVLSLAAGAVLDREDPAFPDFTRQVAVTVTDSGGASLKQALTIQVGDRNEAPTAIALDNDVFPENAAGLSANLIVSDEDTNDTFTFAIEAGLNGDLFEISQNGVLSLAAGAVLDHEDPAFPDPTRQVAVTVTDSGGASLTQALTIQVENVDEPFSIPGLRDDDGRLIVDIPVQLSADPADFPASFQVPFVDDDVLGDDPGLVPDFVFFGSVTAFRMTDDDILESADVPDFVQVTFRNDGSFSLVEPDTLTAQDLAELEDLVLEIEVRLFDDSGQGLLVDPPALADGPIDVALTFTFSFDLDENAVSPLSAFSAATVGDDGMDVPLAGDDVIAAQPSFGDLGDNVIATATIAYADAIDAVYNLLANDAAPDGGPLEFVGVNAGGLIGQLVDDGAGMLTYTLHATDDLDNLVVGDGVLLDRFEYTIIDGDGRTASASVEVAIPEAAVDDGYQVSTAAANGPGAAVDPIAA